MRPARNTGVAPASDGGTRWTRARRRYAARVWGVDGEPGAREWAGLGAADRGRLARRAMAVAVASIVISNALIGLETFLLVQLSYNGGQLTVEGTIGAPNFPDIVTAVVVCIVVNVVLGVVMLRPQVRWFELGSPADHARRVAVQHIPGLQVVGTMIAWAAAVLSYVILSARDLTTSTLLGVTVAFTLAGTSCACLTYLFAERASRPLMMVALADDPASTIVHSVRGRMLAVWAVSSAVPMIGLVILNTGRHLDLLPRVTGSVDWAALVLAVVGLASGARVVVLVGQSLSDPLTELRTAVEKVRAGDFEAHVDVYDSSEIGVLQHGFNEMVTGLDERERMRELFARHVGDTVAELAIEKGMGLHGTNAEVGVLLVDIIGSTTIAQERRPEDTAALLNEFFEIVAQVVDQHAGFVNKFEGDAALAVFGAPVKIDNPAGAALAAARELARALTEALDVQWGIGVSFGVAFAGNIGAERRYEYTVIGDPVNECARLSEMAKTSRVSVLASGAAIADAADEAGEWALLGERVMRGRAEPTAIYGPEALVPRGPASVGEMLTGLLRPARWLGTAGVLKSD
ncbi:adenylate/guanylate cyclase domain-containing protein [Gordonia sp. NB41Y]|uniref:adenylate/guanylate cyclase domain-containing protein n=1 Tax=Gordonia sp. NB41Y TaxID=875808 RepID=UPI0006B1EA1D|nr:adenylate/guanylate cyclase domain-containing protein [Gordonia sp. NB41Y]EMP11227.2 histidine kinase [Gordonia sp. NB41Y]WLP89539.1 adenylate/guanylate cyclase domain-containing protein [Gordonia sp. NB41Y]